MALWQNAQHAFVYFKKINQNFVTLVSTVQYWLVC